MLKSGMLSDVLEILEIGSGILVAPDTLPLSLTHLKMFIEQPVMPDIFPPALKSLYCASVYQYSTIHIPSSVLPASLKSLILAKHVLLETGSLPSQLCSFTIWSDRSFKPGWLPSSLRTLNLFNQCLCCDGIVPYGVVDLQICNGFDPLRSGYIPSSVQRLTVWNRRRRWNCGRRPASAQAGSIPDSITELFTYVSFGRNIIPSSVTHLTMDFTTEFSIDVIPSSITHLCLGDQHRATIMNGSIPTSVTHFSFYGSGNQLKDLSFIPSSVKYLEMRFARTGRTMILPSTVQQLWLPHANPDQPPKMINAPARVSYSEMPGWRNKSISGPFADPSTGYLRDSSHALGGSWQYMTRLFV